MTQAVDSFGQVTPAAAQKAAETGIAGWLRYLYNTLFAEPTYCHANGLWISAIAEFDTRNWHPPLDSPETGAAHGQGTAISMQRYQYPGGSVGWFTADTMVYPSQFPTVGRYWELAAAPMRDSGFLVGAYGGSLLVDWLVDNGLADRAWECGADAWNSPDGNPNHAVRSKHAVIRQRGGGNVGGVGIDFNDIINPGAWGQWGPDTQPAPPTPTPPPLNGAQTMAGKFLRQSDPNEPEYETIAYCGESSSIGPDNSQTPARFVGGLYVMKFGAGGVGGPVALSCVKRDDEPVFDATKDQWAYLNTLPLIYQAQ